MSNELLTKEQIIQMVQHRIVMETPHGQTLDKGEEAYAEKLCISVDTLLDVLAGHAPIPFEILKDLGMRKKVFYGKLDS